MSSRKYQILTDIVDVYIKTAQPVGSKLIAARVTFDVSPATIRNDMAELEEEGLLTHPHTSAGRIPTEKGYKYYVEHCLKPIEMSREQKEQINKIIVRSQIFEDGLKMVAKALADCMQNAVIVGFDAHSHYYTGISYLFSQSEFKDQTIWQSIGQMIDHLDEAMTDMYERVSCTPQVLIGSENLLGSFMSVVCFKDLFGRNLVTDEAFIGILGPMRMDYNKAVGMLRGVKEVTGN